jgi:hypothetical protein
MYPWFSALYRPWRAFLPGVTSTLIWQVEAALANLRRRASGVRRSKGDDSENVSVMPSKAAFAGMTRDGIIRAVERKSISRQFPVGSNEFPDAAN